MLKKMAIKGVVSGVVLTIAASQAWAAATLSSTGTVTINGNSVAVVVVTADGVPYYGTSGAAGFEGANYLHTPSSQSYTFKIPSSPALAGSATAGVYTPVVLAGDFGVASDGIPFDPLTSRCNGVAGSANNTCSWRVEGLLQSSPGTTTSQYTTGRLGFDSHDGHVMSSGAYHYHGIPCNIVVASGNTKKKLLSCQPTIANGWGNLPASAVTVGYARDGYPVVVKSGVYASYSVATAAGTGRPSNTAYATLGNFAKDMSTLVASGATTFTMPSSKSFGDFTYTGPTSGYGTTAKLGLCNEAANTDTAIKTITGATAAYAYYLTPNFPMIPRCLIGVTENTSSTANQQGFFHAGSGDD
ncbi:MAG: YHYH protein [Magnetococcales bacterium]|nr:YHYH protein [Magnetococcales bacterium]